MRQKITFMGLLFFVFISLNAQTSYFYYYGEERQYLELDARYILFQQQTKTQLATHLLQIM